MISYVIGNKKVGDFMIDTNALKGIIVQNGFSQSRIAKTLGITPKTFYSKMNKRVFDSDEIEVMIKVLKIKDPIAIFFKSNVTY